MTKEIFPSTYYVNISILWIAILILLPGHLLANDKQVLNVVIQPFYNSTGNNDFSDLGKGFSDILISAFSSNRNIAVLERNNLDHINKELSLSLNAETKNDNILKLGKLAKADYFIKGGYSYINHQLVVNAHLYDIKTTHLITSIQKQGQLKDIAQIAESVSLSLYAGISDSLLNTKTELEIDPSPELNLHFMKALGYYYSGLYEHAVSEFLLVQFLNPAHVESNFWIIKSYVENNEIEHAMIEIDKFLNLYPHHSRTKDINVILEKLHGY